MTAATAATACEAPPSGSEQATANDIHYLTSTGHFVRRDPYIHPDNPDLVVVPVFNRYDRQGKTTAVIDLDTFNRLIRSAERGGKGVSPYWHVRGKSAVYGQIKSQRFQIARLILGLDWIDPKGTSHSVEYLDGDPLNLQKGNLRATERYRRKSGVTPPEQPETIAREAGEDPRAFLDRVWEELVQRTKERHDSSSASKREHAA